MYSVIPTIWRYFALMCTWLVKQKYVTYITPVNDEIITKEWQTQDFK